MGHTLVEFEIDRPVQVVGGQIRLQCGPLPEREEQVRPFVVSEHHGHRALDIGQSGVAQWPTCAGGVDDGVVAEQDHRVDAAFGHRRPQPRSRLAAQARQVGCFGNHQSVAAAGAQVRERLHYRPKNVVMLSLTIFFAFAGPTASTTAFSDFSE